MVQLTVEERVLLVTTYLRTGSLEAARNAFRDQFADREPPTKMTVWRNVNKYRETGTSHNRNKWISGRPKIARTIENIETVRQVLERNPTGVSCRRNGTDISKTSFQRIVTRDLRWHPDKMTVRQLNPDNRRRIEFSSWFTPPYTITELWQRIITEVDAVKRNRMLVRRSVRDMLRRTHLCIERDGGHVEGNHA